MLPMTRFDFRARLWWQFVERREPEANLPLTNAHIFTPNLGYGLSILYKVVA